MQIVYLTVGKESYQMEVPERFLAKVPRDFDVRSSRKVVPALYLFALLFSCVLASSML